MTPQQRKDSLEVQRMINEQLNGEHYTNRIARAADHEAMLMETLTERTDDLKDSLSELSQKLDTLAQESRADAERQQRQYKEDHRLSVWSLTFACVAAIASVCGTVIALLTFLGITF